MTSLHIFNDRVSSVHLYFQHQVPETNILTRMEDLMYPGVDAAVFEVNPSHC